MKKNYFYAILNEELSLLLQGARSRSSAERERLFSLCKQKHERLTRRLMREFITPVNREDLYRVSLAVCDAFLPIKSTVSSQEQSLIEQAATVLASASFPLNESVLDREKELSDLWEGTPVSREGKDCRAAFCTVMHAMILTVLKNV